MSILGGVLDDRWLLVFSFLFPRVDFRVAAYSAHYYIWVRVDTVGILFSFFGATPDKSI